MAVNYISLPDLGTELALIADEISIIEENITPDVFNLLKPTFIFKGSEDCSTFYLEDVTSYTVWDGSKYIYLDENKAALNVTYFYRTACGDIIDCSSEPMTVHGKLSFENIYGDGEYCVSIEVTYTEPPERFTPEIVYTTTVEECLTQNCCLNSLNDLRKEIADCMAAFSCKINEFKCIGRNYVKLTSRYLKMSNLLWVIDHTDSSCSDYENLKCLFKKI
tara:strand:+ start:5165 stop:5824 length:660 start_codon:yes stop_codon:yes gene_type:complete